MICVWFAKQLVRDITVQDRTTQYKVEQHMTNFFSIEYFFLFYTIFE